MCVVVLAAMLTLMMSTVVSHEVDIVQSYSGDGFIEDEQLEDLPAYTIEEWAVENRITNSHNVHTNGQQVDEKFNLKLNENRISAYAVCLLRNGSLVHVSSGSTCCNGNLVDSSRYLCCGGDTYPRFEGIGCCGGEVYETNSGLLCNHRQQLIDRPSLCGSRTYDPLESHCCMNSVLHPRSEGNLCCGHSIYRSSTHFCLNNKVIEYNRNNTTTEHEIVSGNIVEGNQMKYVGSNMLRSDTLVINGTNSSSMNKEQNQVRRKQVDLVLLICGIVFITVTAFSVLCILLAFLIRYVCKLRNNQNVYDQRRSRTGSRDNNNFIYNNSNTTVPADKAGLLDKNVFENGSDISSIDNALIDKKNSILNFSKEKWIKGSNIFPLEMEDAFTQTDPEKVCNMRTILGESFEHSFDLCSSVATAAMPGVRLILPKPFLDNKPIQVRGTIFSNLSEIHVKLIKDEGEMLASAVVEYAVCEQLHLPDHAVVILPFTSREHDLMVKTFHTNGGSNSSIESRQVPKKREDEEDDVDMYYVVEESEVRIYTRTITGFYCTTSRHRFLHLSIFIFGTYDRRTNPLSHSVRLKVYIAEEVAKFEKYEQDLIDKERKSGLELKNKGELNLPYDLSVDDVIVTLVTPTEDNHQRWTQTDATGGESLQLSKIAHLCPQCGHCHMTEQYKPICIELCLRNPDGVQPNYQFEGNIEVNIARKNREEKTTNSFGIKLEDFP